MRLAVRSRQVTVNDLGDAKKLWSRKRPRPSSTEPAKATDIKARIESIRQQAEEATSDYDKESYRSVSRSSPAC